MSCGTCGGSGQHEVWLDIAETTRWVVAVEPEHPFVEAHPSLAARRFVQPHELDVFQVAQRDESLTNTLEFRDATGAPLFQAALATIDQKRDKVLERQYLEFFAIRRDAAYRLCGTDGVVSLIGQDLAGANDALALHPIRVHNRLWIVLGTAFIVFSGAMLALLRGTGDYYNRSNSILTCLWILGTVFGLIAIGALLRGKRPSLPGIRMPRLRPLDLRFGIAALVALLAIPVVSALSKPSSREVRGLLAAGDAAHARIAVDAMKKSAGAASTVGELEDSVMMLEAQKQPPAARLSLLDAVGLRGGVHAAQAASEARAERIGQLRRFVEAGEPSKAISAAKEWFGTDLKRDPAVAKVVADAFDAQTSQCPDSVCRLVTARNADLTSPTPERADRAANEERALADVLSTKWNPGGDTADNVKSATAAIAVAERAQKVFGQDAQLRSDAQLAATRLRESISGVKLLGADSSVVENVLNAQGTLGDALIVDGMAVYRTFDAKKRCKGLYVVGSAAGSRAIHGGEWTPTRLVSQALGRSVTLSPPGADSQTVTRTVVNGVPVVARWNKRELWELRVGDAEP